MITRRTLDFCDLEFGGYVLLENLHDGNTVIEGAACPAGGPRKAGKCYFLKNARPTGQHETVANSSKIKTADAGPKRIGKEIYQSSCKFLCP